MDGGYRDGWRLSASLERQGSLETVTGSYAVSPAEETDFYCKICASPALHAHPIYHNLSLDRCGA
jgi:hypothetical protein